MFENFVYLYIVIVIDNDKFKAKAEMKAKQKNNLMQSVYETLTKPEQRKLARHISQKGNLKLTERETNLNVNTIKRAAAGMQVTLISAQALRQFITNN